LGIVEGFGAFDSINEEEGGGAQGGPHGSGARSGSSSSGSSGNGMGTGKRRGRPPKQLVQDPAAAGAEGEGGSLAPLPRQPAAKRGRPRKAEGGVGGSRSYSSAPAPAPLLLRPSSSTPVGTVPAFSVFDTGAPASPEGSMGGSTLGGGGGSSSGIGGTLGGGGSSSGIGSSGRSARQAVEAQLEEQVGEGGVEGGGCESQPSCPRVYTLSALLRLAVVCRLSVVPRIVLPHQAQARQAPGPPPVYISPWTWTTNPYFSFPGRRCGMLRRVPSQASAVRKWRRAH